MIFLSIGMLNTRVELLFKGRVVISRLSHVEHHYFLISMKHLTIVSLGTYLIIFEEICRESFGS